MGAFLKSDFDKNLAKKREYLLAAEEQDRLGLFILKWGIILTCSTIILACVISIYKSVK